MEFLKAFDKKAISNIVSTQVKKQVEKQFNKHVKPQIQAVLKNEFTILAKEQAAKALQDKRKVIKVALIFFASILMTIGICVAVYKVMELISSHKSHKACCHCHEEGECCCEKEGECCCEKEDCQEVAEDSQDETSKEEPSSEEA